MMSVLLVLSTALATPSDAGKARYRLGQYTAYAGLGVGGAGDLIGLGTSIAAVGAVDLETAEVDEDKVLALRPIGIVGSVMGWSGGVLLNSGALIAHTGNRASGSQDNAILGSIGLGFAAAATGLGIASFATFDRNDLDRPTSGLLGNASSLMGLGSYVFGVAQLIKNTNVRRSLRDDGLVRDQPVRPRVGLALSPSSVGLNGSW